MRDTTPCSLVYVRQYFGETYLPHVLGRSKHTSTWAHGSLYPMRLTRHSINLIALASHASYKVEPLDMFFWLVKRESGNGCWETPKGICFSFSISSVSWLAKRYQTLYALGRADGCVSTSTVSSGQTSCLTDLVEKQEECGTSHVKEEKSV